MSDGNEIEQFESPRQVASVDAYLRNASEAIQDTIRSKANRVSIDSLTSAMSGFSTTSDRHARWQSNIRTPRYNTHMTWRQCIVRDTYINIIAHYIELQC